MSFRSTLFSAGLLALLPFAAPAQELITEAGGWSVYRDASMGNGCYMMTSFEDGSIVQLGHDASEDITFLTLFSTDWTALENDKVYPITFDLDGQVWTADGHAVSDAEIGGILVQIEDEDFIVDLALKNTLTMSYEGEEVVALDLAGTNDAVQATIACMGG
ncbi:hypothetical protein [Pseudogemmobacter faecipullorum]|uniref:Uncharacterized protein n=1 Tax=Pseudogemmobacter faecipullorum TaxID=2755041 RepID=A0ABS8CL82_9RHOB|nr:hypothetical protein [Pseudogemmobacter faecipullorum]MCB5410121.1 hypothetical protein [Pseudogemmobacter faecipullorum]